MISLPRISLLLLFLTSSILFFLSFQKQPIGYLHSWNQVTTLSHISEIASDLRIWNKPFDVVTRLSAHPRPKKLDLNTPYTDFRIYEEFPLYHLLSSFVVRIDLSPEGAAKLISIISFFFAGTGLMLLSKELSGDRSSFFTVFLWSSSFPILYYGQAIMSDMSMTASTIWSCYFLCLYHRLKIARYLTCGLLLVTLSSLFKSYGLLAAIPWIFFFLVRGEILTALRFCLLSSLPVLSWHGWTLYQSGQQEILSHSLTAKLTFILSKDFLLVTQKYYFRYLSYFPGVILLIFLIQHFIKRQTQESRFKKTLTTSWIIGSLTYLTLSADKLSDHDYYILLIIPGLFILAGHALNHAWRFTSAHKHKKFLTPLFILAAGSPIPLTYLSLTKALTENQDVSICADLIATNIPEKAIAGYFSDSVRYNSLAYYGNRFGLIVEQKTFPLSRYTPYGVSYLVVNVPDDQYTEVESWITNQDDKLIEPLARKRKLQDFKSRERTCAIYRIR